MQRRKFTATLMAAILAFSLFQPFSIAYAYEGEIPSSYDLAAKGLVTPAKSQGPWSSCWAFGALSSIESNLVKNGYADDTVDLSEKYLIWFATKPLDRELAIKQPSALLHPDKHSQEGEGEHLDSSDPSDRYDLGQYDWVVVSALSSGLALESEDACPYMSKEGSVDHGTDADGHSFSISSGDGDWSVDGERTNDKIYRLKNADLILGTANVYQDENTGELVFKGYREETIDQVKRALLDHGAVNLNYTADVSTPDQEEDPTYFNYQNWAQYRSVPSLADHSVSIIGWEDNFPKEKFKNASGELPPKNGAWKVKNSWGRKNGGDYNTSSWGVNDEGWFYLSYYDKGIESFLSYDIELQKDKPLDIMQYDFIGMNNFGFPPFVYSRDAYADDDPYDLPRVANVFEAPYNLEISEVSFAPHINDGSAHIEIYVLGNNYRNPEAGDKVYSETVPFEHAGYHTHKLSEPIVLSKGTLFSVVETIEGDYEGERAVEIPVEVGYNEEYLEDHPEEQDGPKVTYKTVVNPGESYAYIDGWLDNTKLGKMPDYNIKGITYGNNLIKVFIEPTDKEAPEYNTITTYDYVVTFATGAVVVGGVVFFVRKRKSKKMQAASH